MRNIWLLVIVVFIAIALALSGTLAWVSYFKLMWMIEHGMNKHAIVFCVLAVILVYLLALCSWRVIKAILWTRGKENVVQAE